ncbi:competence protein CoiA family protein [Niallia oryzisoli]|uniref:competence protein CoiA family protein n=1 Tax=Niallia oryzisoli TaxID=1737571 RepID=UPI0037351A4D
MARYAYLPFNTSYEEYLSNVEIDEYEDRKVLKVDSTTITDEEYLLIKKVFKDNLYCFSCDSKMKFVKPNNRHQHFAHISRKNCFEAESLAHASVKKHLYDKFKERGYKVEVERSFSARGKRVRTDIAVKEKNDILAIEVQASPSINLSTIAERTNVYADLNIPTAWVIVLDSFFGEGNFTSTKIEVLVKHEDGTSSYKERLLPYSTPTPFIVRGDIPKSFLFLLDTYKYVISVNHDGHFFVIRRANLIDFSLEIYRIEQEKVVEVLLATDIKILNYRSENKVNKKLDYEFQPREYDHFEEREYEGEILLGIDFKKAFEEEQEQLKNEDPLDILQIIEETKKRELQKAKKNLIMDSLDDQIVQLKEIYNKTQEIYDSLRIQLEKQQEKIESKNKVGKIKRTEELEETLQRDFNTEKLVKKLLLAEVERHFKGRSLAQLTPFASQDIPYIERPLYDYIVDKLKGFILHKNNTELDINYDDVPNIEAVEIDLLLKKVILEKKSSHQEEKSRLLKKGCNESVERQSLSNKSSQEQLYEDKQKDTLCKEIDRMQKETGLNIVEDIEKLRKNKLNDIKKTHHSVSTHYQKMVQFSLF